MAIDWAEWPARGRDEIYTILRLALLDTVQHEEARRRRPDRIQMGREAYRFWRSYWMHNPDLRYAMSPTPGPPQEIRFFYGMEVVEDRHLDAAVGVRRETAGRIADDNIMSPIRLVSDGFGSELVLFQAFNHPDRLQYEVTISGPDRVRYRRQFSYAFLGESMRRARRRDTEVMTAMYQNFGGYDLAREEAELMRELNEAPAIPQPPTQLRGDGSIDLARYEAAVPKQPQVSKEMSPMRLAWLT